MIRLSDAALLAYTKLRARKVRLIVTVVISSLLFGVLALSSFVVRGVVNSINNFAEEGFGKRYLVTADPNSSATPDLFSNKEILDRATALQKDQIARKKAEAKKLGIEYDANSDRPVVSEVDGPSGKERYLDPGHPLGLQAINEYLVSHPSPGLAELKKLGKPYGATKYYESRYLAFGGSDNGILKVLKDGKESFDENNQNNYDPFGAGLESFNSSWSLMNGELLKTFTLDGSDGSSVTKEGLIPIVAPYTAVEQLLNLKPLPGSASPTVRLERLKEVRAKASKLEFSVCYRNPASMDLISQAISVKQEIERNKKNKDYQKPKLIYSTPSEACGPAAVTRDARTASEKTMDNKQTTFRRLFGEEEPTQSILKFKVVGVSPDPPSYNAAFLDQLISSVLTSNIGSNWFTPLELRANNPIIAKFFPDNQFMGRPNNYIVELPSAESAKKFLDEASCKFDQFAGGPSVAIGPPLPGLGGISDECVKDGKVFMLYPYGSSSVALEEFQDGFSKFFRIAALVLTAIAGLIMMGTVGRIIADARRETAVFRAIGAKRLDLSQVYITYAFVIALMIGVCAILAGFLLSQVAQTRWGSQFTVKALVAYNARDLSREFQLYYWHTRDLLYIVLAAISAGLLSTILPLIRNLRRNPIRDMRDEN